MIRVRRRREPSRFDSLVRQPGIAFLMKCPAPTTAEWKSHAYWSNVKEELYHAFNQICCYSCHWIPQEGSRTCDHFVSKCQSPADAYEWRNMRLAGSIVNGRKATSTHIPDPCSLPDGSFIIEFPSLLVRPGTCLKSERSLQIESAITTLGLNDESTCLATRRSWLREYCLGRFDLDYLRGKAPFLAMELERQNVVQRIKTMMNFR